MARAGILTAKNAKYANPEGEAAEGLPANQANDPNAEGRAGSPQPAVGEESVLASRLVGSLAPPMQSGAHGVTRSAINSQPSTLNFFNFGLRWLVGIVAVAALGLTVMHLGVPQLAVSERTLNLARKFLVPPKEQSDFEYLAAKPIWSGQPLKTLLQHAHLANYNRTLVNWKLEDQLYREFVLSPEIFSPPGLAATVSTNSGAVDVRPRNVQDREISADSRPRLHCGERENAVITSPPATINPQPPTDLNWRRPLWEHFYPRVRKESDPLAAAEVVLRLLPEKPRVANLPAVSEPEAGTADHEVSVPVISGSDNANESNSIVALWNRGTAD
ncbi:MAG TPA: hypothetical protein VFZ59_23670, partial [Verrucomicrobiae bacterium]|nr:hypothetical protein [Verrucomicrobiae bacterium]